MIERLVCLLSTHNIALGNSVHDQMINEDLSLSSKCFVLGLADLVPHFNFLRLLLILLFLKIL